MNALLWAEHSVDASSAARLRDATAAALSQRIDVAFHTGQINRRIRDYGSGLQGVTKASPPKDITVSQAQGVCHPRLDPDCASTDYRRCSDSLAEMLRPYHLSCLRVERAKYSGFASENNHIAGNGGRRTNPQLGLVFPANSPVRRVHCVEEEIE